MPKTVAIIDDDEDILNLVALHLEKAHFSTAKFTNAYELYRYLDKTVPDLLILDLMLPDEDGIEICKRLRGDDKFIKMSIIMLTARGEEIDRIMGLELGADDYITKPFSPRELVARVKAIFRRESRHIKDKTLSIGQHIHLNPNTYTLTIENNNVELTTTEFKLLSLLISKKGWVLSRDQILEYLWNNEKYVIDRTVDVHIRHLRKKRGKYGNIIKNVRGIGYKIET